MTYGHPPKVGYVVKRYPRFSETFIVNEILAHQAAGVEIEIFSLRPPEDTHFQDIIAKVRSPVHYVPHDNPRTTLFWEAVNKTSELFPNVWKALAAGCHDSGRDVLQGLLVARAVHQKKITHLHAHFASVATTVARLAAGFAGIPYTFTAHAKDIFHENVDHDDLRRKLMHAAKIITVSDYNLRHLQSNFGIAANQVERVYNGLDLDRFPFVEPTVRLPRIAAVGRLVEKKGFADLISACAILAKKNPKFECVILGSGELCDALQSQITQLKIEKIVRLLGSLPQNTVVETIHSAAVLAAPCVVGHDGNRDGLPTVLLEAMALGTPCVSTDVTGIPEVIRDGTTGLVVPQHNPFVLAQALERLLEDANLRVALAKSARRLIERQFDISHNTARLREIFCSADKACAKTAGQVR